MKRSKIFLAITGGALAIVGVVAAKSTKAYSPLSYSFYTGGICTHANTGVVSFTVNSKSNPSASNIKKVLSPARTAFQTSTGTACQVPLYTRTTE